MVSVHPKPPPGQGFAHFYSNHFGGDPISTPAMNIAEESAGASVEDPSRKIRKPYTITKSRENWSEQEHDRFIEALHLFDRDWKKIEAFVGSKTVIQIRSHAQKYFMKVRKNGTSEHIPPPRPKRKAAHPYPHKAPKKVASQPSKPLSSSSLLNPRYALGPQSMPLPGNIVGSAPVYTLIPSTMLTDCESPLSKDEFASSGTMTHNWSSNCNEIAPHVWTSNEANHLVNENLNEKRDLFLVSINLIC
ncbi:hypothetical protein ACS0TY_019353 [Phlomoides rotata]